ncbi:MAG: ParB/RepB/Spo0J family partition protein [Phycisphaera sp.]|nr:ParB/RepB/Spo0J family partition protein [Phycisphaera sp.]
MSKSKAKKPRLGRGLSSLMATAVPIEPPVEDDVAEVATALPQADVTTETSDGDAIVTPPDQTAHPERSALPNRAEVPAPAPAAVAPPSQPYVAPAAAASRAAVVDNGVDSLESDDDDVEAGLQWLPLGSIVSNPFQPRRTFDKAALEQLAASIKQDGVMQPIVVRPASKDGTYQLVAGERRWRAATKAGLPKIPAIVRTLSDQQMAEWAVIENLQREDLDPIERAQAFSRLSNHFSMSHEQIAQRVGSDRSTISNLMRLLDLDENIQIMIKTGALSAGHGRALLSLGDGEAQTIMAKRAVAGGWSVRMMEAAVRRAGQADETPKERAKATRSALFADLEKQIATQLGTKVQIRPSRKKNAGTLCLEFYNIEQFDDLMEKLGVKVD